NDAAFPDRKAVLNRGGTADSAVVFDLAGADDVTIDHLSMTNAYADVYAAYGADADRVTVSNSDLSGARWYGLYFAGQNDDWVITGNRIHDNYVNLQADSAARITIVNNLVYSSTFGGGIQINNGL